MLYDKTMADSVSAVMFMTPTAAGKGVLVLPTASGNTLIGPDSKVIESADDKSTTAEGLGFILEKSKKIVPNISQRGVITSFSGIRAVPDGGDFIIEPSVSENVINLAGIESPGLASSPAIAEYTLSLLAELGFKPEKKAHYTDRLESKPRFSTATDEQRKKLIEENSQYGNIICRCETVTEAEVRAAIRSKVGAVTVDGVKRRCRAGMGRCQGGFCRSRVIEILADELGVPVESILKDEEGSNFIVE